MKTDVIFYELIKELPQIFFELIDKPDTNPNIYTFIAPEVKPDNSAVSVKPLSKSLS